jgi:hypothetical protein
VMKRTLHFGNIVSSVLPLYYESQVFGLAPFSFTDNYLPKGLGFELVFYTTIILLATMFCRSRGSSVSIVSDYGLDDRAIGVRSPAGATDFFL